MTKAEALKILSEAEFRSFDHHDWYAFSGCESKHPLICDNRSDYLIIMDGGSFTFYTSSMLETFSDDGVYRFNIA